MKSPGLQTPGTSLPPPQIPLIDPTANVLSLVAAAISRQDDLRVSEFRRIDELMKKQDECTKEISDVHLQAQRDLAIAESRRIDALTLAESRRIDAILAAASNAVALASAKADAQAATLAQQVVTSADALRAQVATTASATDKRITLLEQSQYQIGGRDVQREQSRASGQWSTGIIVSSIISGIGFVILLALKLSGH